LVDSKASDDFCSLLMAHARLDDIALDLIGSLVLADRCRQDALALQIDRRLFRSAIRPSPPRRDRVVLGKVPLQREGQARQRLGLTETLIVRSAASNVLPQNSHGCLRIQRAEAIPRQSRRHPMAPRSPAHAAAAPPVSGARTAL
jgi:hypothetical protein